MSKEIPKAYDAQKVEDNIYKIWEESGFFNPDNLPAPTRFARVSARRELWQTSLEGKEYYTVAMPPPNVTGILHLGHALENSLMDVEVRYQRMKGKKVLLLPGTDHAAVATQARVEDNLKKQGIENPRQKYGREKLLEIIRKYAEDSKATILSQIKRMGTSCDWSRLAYTFDEKRNRCVNEIFKRMYEDGLIYKGYRVVNWSVKGQSTCSDDELVYVDQKTKVYTFKYAKDFPISIASTRPETKLGDTAVAVHPNDKRYQQYIGKEYTVDVGAAKPLRIKIIADQNVDPKYGTGALGVTPAHSQIDYEMYLKNKEIGIIPVIGQDGKMTENAGKYKGMTVVEARKKFVEWLRKEELLLNEQEIDHNVGTSDRFKDIVEALPMEQWFVDVNKKIKNKNKSLKDLMREAVNKINIQPKRFEKVYLTWIDNLRDWNISRQIWWGHRIPIWYKDKEIKVSGECPGKGWIQDEDTLDTWFSSGTWTFSTLGWPEQTEDLKKFHPTSWMQMGYEILFFWMARMILMSEYALEEIPFHDVYIHGILRDRNGKKFSKSLGNGIDPIEMIDRYGCDALRISLLRGVTPGNDSRFYEDKVEASRNFVNKLWNIARYITLSNDTLKIDQLNVNTVADHWIVSKLQNLIKSVDKNLADYNFGQAADDLYAFMWNDFADWYIEITKFQPNREVLIYVLDNLLRLLHPFIPFVTEEIWKNFGTGKLLMVESWPQAQEKLIDYKAEKDFSLLQDIVIQIRNFKAQYKIEPKKIINLYTIKKYPEEEQQIIEKLGRAQLNHEDTCPPCFASDAGAAKGAKTTKITNNNFNFSIILGEYIDVEAEKKRILEEIKNLKKNIAGLEKRLSNKTFITKAPKNIVEQEKQNLDDRKKTIDNLENSLKQLS